VRRLFRPVYGEHFEVRPKHWWNPKERKAARLAAKVCDYEWEHGGREEVARRFSRALFFGEGLH
jgi:hypothetical protein